MSSYSYTIPFGSNGMQGFQEWECYMMIKYGSPRFFWTWWAI